MHAAWPHHLTCPAWTTLPEAKYFMQALSVPLQECIKYGQPTFAAPDGVAGPPPSGPGHTGCKMHQARNTHSCVCWRSSYCRQCRRTAQPQCVLNISCQLATPHCKPATVHKSSSCAASERAARVCLCVTQASTTTCQVLHTGCQLQPHASTYSISSFKQRRRHAACGPGCSPKTPS